MSEESTSSESIEASGAQIVSLEGISEQADRLSVEQDGVATLRDIESEANDESGLRDRSIVDREENRELGIVLGIVLDSTGQPEPDLD